MTVQPNVYGKNVLAGEMAIYLKPERILCLLIFFETHAVCEPWMWSAQFQAEMGSLHWHGVSMSLWFEHRVTGFTTDRIKYVCTWEWSFRNETRIFRGSTFDRDSSMSMLQLYYAQDVCKFSLICTHKGEQPVLVYTLATSTVCFTFIQWNVDLMV